MNKNDIITLVINAISSEGFGIGRHEGLAVFVPNTAIGDKALVKILKVKKSYAYAKLQELLTPSEYRIKADCSAFNRCGGCVYRHIDYSHEAEIKQKKVEDCIKRIGAIPLNSKPIIKATKFYGYRNKAQLPISANRKTGFYALHSHRIIENEGCLLTPPIFNEISDLFGDFLNEYNLSPYNEAENSGLIRHLYLRIAKATNEIMVVIVINGDTLPHSDMLIDKLKNLLGKSLVSVQLNINKENTNVILGNTCKVIYGREHITDILCGLKIRISPLSFYQVNHDMTELLYKKAAEYLEPEGKTIIDLYCGAGTIGLSLAQKAKKVIGVEIVPEAINDANFNARLNGIENAEFICADAAKAAKKLAEQKIKADAIVLDPPRKGCSEALLKTIANDFNPEKIVYISCDPATLGRDSKILTGFGYELIEYTPVDLFPRTQHIETVALFMRHTTQNPKGE